MDKSQKEEVLCDAAKNSDTDRVKQLLEEGVNPSAACGILQMTPLHLAAGNGHHETVSALLTAGADVNAQDMWQNTPLRLAAENGHHETVSALLTAGADVNAQELQRTPLHLAAENGHHETVSALLAAGADVNVRDTSQRTPLHLAAMRGHPETVTALLTAGADVNVQDGLQRTPLHLAAEKGYYEIVSALLTAGADVNVQDTWEKTPLHEAALRGYHETVSALLTAGADVNTQDRQGFTPLQYALTDGIHTKCVEVLLQHRADEHGNQEGLPRQGKWFDTVLADFYNERKISPASSDDLLIGEAVIQTGKTREQVLNFKANYCRIMGEHKWRSSAVVDYDSGIGSSNCSPEEVLTGASVQNLEQMLDTILSRLEETDVRLLMRVWSARTGDQESLVAGESADLIRGMMKSEYIPTDGFRILETDMLAAGISFPAIVRDIPGVPEELKYTRTTEAAVGPTGGELEIPGLVKLVAPPDVLQQDTTITISTVDVAAILRDHESVNWLSGYPWSLAEDACPRELLDQVLFSPAVDINLHGAQLNGPVEVQTWRPPGSEGMECILLKHHDGEGWTDITASTRHHIDSDRLSILLPNFSITTILWAPVDMVKAVGKAMLAAFSSRTVDCQFAAYSNPGVDDMEFHIVCRDRSMETDEYLQGFKLCGSNDATFPLYNGDVIKVNVSLCGCQQSTEVNLRSTLCKQSGQKVQMVLRTPNRYPAIGKVDVLKFQQPHWHSVCQLTVREEGNTLPSDPQRGSTTEEPQRTQSTPTDQVESVRQKLAATSITGTEITRNYLPPETSCPQAAAIRSEPNTGGSENKPAVLLINDGYSNSHSDVSTIHRQMARFLASKGAVVYSTVLGATKDDKDDAASDRVQLIFPTTYTGDERKPSLDWLTWDHQTRYPNLPTDVDFILGHVKITSQAARQIKEQRLPDAKLVQVTHEIPEETSQYKGDEEVMSIGEQTASILDDLRHADVIFSVGPLVYDYYTHQIKQLQLQHHEFLPKPSDIFSEMQLNYVNTKTKVVLSVGKIKGMERLKGYDLVAKSMFIVMEQLHNTKWRAFGVSPEDFPESKKAIQAHVEKGKIHFTPLKSTTQKELSEEMKKAHVVLMPSRAEPFGLVGLEAIAAGVPVLVSHKSGLAWFLDKHPDLDRPIVEIEDDDDEAAKTLAKRIIKVLKDGSKEFEAAKKMKEHLLAAKPWEASHHKFLKTFGL